MTNDQSIPTLWVVLRRSRRNINMDQVTVVYTSHDRHKAEGAMEIAREVTEECFPGSAIYELAEC